jgi:predicted AAA+ superfamily ATPase
MQMDEGADDEPNLVNQGRQPAIYDPQQAERQDEQRALDDRFALKVFIEMPRKTEYEHMVLSYARRAGIDMDQEELMASFKVWCMRHNHDLVGGRTARDFIVDYLPPFVQSVQSEQIEG